MEKILVKGENIKAAAKTTAKQVAIGITFATLYFILTAVNPLATMTGASSLSAWFNIRWANILRGFAVFSPAAIIGMSLGAHWWNVYSGKASLFSYGFTPMLTLLISIGIFKFSTQGKNTLRDVIVLAIGGALTGAVVTLRLAGFAMLLDNQIWTELLTYAAMWKITWHIMLYVGGYWLARSFFVKE